MESAEMTDSGRLFDIFTSGVVENIFLNRNRIYGWPVLNYVSPPFHNRDVFPLLSYFDDEVYRQMLLWRAW